MLETSHKNFIYKGFSSPNGTIVPDDVFDVLLPQLTDPELRVLLYIIRKTFGWKKDSDNISLSQMVHGITARDGRILDGGAGLSKASAARGIQGLTKKGIIKAVRNISKERGNEPTTYQLRFEGDPLSQIETRGGLSQSETPLVSNRDTQQTTLQTTEISLPEIPEGTPSNDKNGDNSVSQPISANGFSLAGKGKPVSDQPQSASTQHQTPTFVSTADSGRNAGDRDNKPVVRHGMEGLGDVLSRFSREDTGAAAIATQAPPKRGRGRPRRPLPEIPPDQYEDLVRLIRDFSREFGNFDEAESNITQAVNLMVAKGIDFNTFYMYAVEGKRAILSRTKPIQKKMAWWYTWMRNNIPESKDRQSNPSLPN